MSKAEKIFYLLVVIFVVAGVAFTITQLNYANQTFLIYLFLGILIIDGIMLALLYNRHLK